METWLNKNLASKSNYSNISKCSELSVKLYEKGYSALDLLKYIKNSDLIENQRKYSLLVYFN